MFKKLRNDITNKVEHSKESESRFWKLVDKDASMFCTHLTRHSLNLSKFSFKLLPSGQDTHA